MAKKKTPIRETKPTTTIPTTTTIKHKKPAHTVNMLWALCCVGAGVLLFYWGWWPILEPMLSAPAS
jgi:CHASE2 domain-containing sensor protein